MARKTVMKDGGVVKPARGKGRARGEDAAPTVADRGLPALPGAGGRLEWWEVGRLKAHPLNWRTHPAAQKVAMREVLDAVGWAGAILVNARTGHILDGHLRLELAVERGESEVPCVVFELSEAQERLALATHDSLAKWAEPDAEKFAELRGQVEADFGGVAEGIAAMFAATQADATKAEHAAAARDEQVGGWWVSVTCKDERTQQTVYELMTGEGREVRVLTL